MHESFLHYVWQFQYFNKQDLKSTENELIQIFNPGILNSHAGPDFSNARIGIDSVQWVGTIEIHIYSSDWMVHKHQDDGAYENVVLHVVWENDKPIKRKDGSWLPTLELKKRIEEDLILKYRKLINSPEEIPCAGLYSNVAAITRLSMIDKSVSIRLERKANDVLDIYKRTNNDWNETCYQVIGKNFGFKVNAEPFQQLTQSLPYRIILKHANSLYQMEALIFGQAGFLDGPNSHEYFIRLKREHELLGHKYGLMDRRLKKSQWRFLRLRPANFPTIRLAQLASLLFKQKNIFSNVLECSRYDDLVALLTIQQSSYWQHHYAFDSEEKTEVPSFGEMSINSVIINSVVPLFVAYGRMNDEQEWVDNAISILQHVPCEQNAIIRRWSNVNQSATSAFDSQGLIELYNSFCLKKRCLDCNIGSFIMNSV